MASIISGNTFTACSCWLPANCDWILHFHLHAKTAKKKSLRRLNILFDAERNSSALLEIKGASMKNPSGGLDSIAWLRTTNSQLSIKSAWNEVMNKKREVKWAELVWHKKYIPKHTIVIWLAVKQRLMTKDKLVKLGLTNNAKCVLCNCYDEDINHFFVFFSNVNIAAIFGRPSWGKVSCAIMGKTGAL